MYIMHCFIFLSLYLTAFGDTLRQQGYTFSNPTIPFGPAGFPGVNGQNIPNRDFSDSVVPDFGGDYQRELPRASPLLCGDGDVLDSFGDCVTPQITRNVYVYSPPKIQQQYQTERVVAPPPKLEYNIVLIRAPEKPESQQPIVIPPPQRKTIVYVLNKNSEDDGLKKIEVPYSPAHTPEVFYVNYNEGDNPQLPIGIDLQSALSAAVNHQGQRVQDEFSSTIAGGGITGEGLSVVTSPTDDYSGIPGLGVSAGYSIDTGGRLGGGNSFGAVTGGAFGGRIHNDGSFGNNGANVKSDHSFSQLPTHQSSSFYQSNTGR